MFGRLLEKDDRIWQSVLFFNKPADQIDFATQINESRDIRVHGTIKFGNGCLEIATGQPFHKVNDGLGIYDCILCTNK